MNSIIGFSDILNEEPSLSADHRKYIQLILNNGRILLQLINDILDFSKIEAGKLNTEIIEVSLFEFLEDLNSLLRPLALGKGLDFEILQCGDLPAIIHTDPVRVRQCLVNLVSNAVKFTSSGHVFVNVYIQRQDESDYIRFDVEDTGVGIPEDKIRTIFEALPRPTAAQPANTAAPAWIDDHSPVSQPAGRNHRSSQRGRQRIGLFDSDSHWGQCSGSAADEPL